MASVLGSLFYCVQFNLFYGFPYNNVVSRYMYACIMCSMHTSISIILFIRFTTSDFLNFNWYLLQLLAYLQIGPYHMNQNSTLLELYTGPVLIHMVWPDLYISCWQGEPSWLSSIIRCPIGCWSASCCTEELLWFCY